MNTPRISISALTLVLIMLAWAWDKPLLAWIAAAIAILDLPANVIANGVKALKRVLDALAVVGPPLLFLPIFFLHRALGAAAGAGDPGAIRLLPVLQPMLVINIAINVAGLLYLIAFKTPLLNQLPPRSEHEARSQEPPTIPQDELDRREAAKKALADIRAGRA